jgi:uncharacterized protein YqjF (DUF2071 family)
MDRVGPTLRPPGAPRGFQRWHRLLFSHWEVPESVLRPLVPHRLGLDSFEGRYFVGVVAFTMQKVRPWLWAPPIPTATTLCRARVHHEPYAVSSTEHSTVTTTLLDAAGLPTNGARTPDLFSPNVDVDVYAIEAV